MCHNLAQFEIILNKKLDYGIAIDELYISIFWFDVWIVTNCYRTNYKSKPLKYLKQKNKKTCFLFFNHKFKFDTLKKRVLLTSYYFQQLEIRVFKMCDILKKYSHNTILNEKMSSNCR